MAGSTKVIQAVSGVAELSPYIPGKPIETLEREYGVQNAVKVASNENPLGPSSKVISHLANMLNQPLELARYPDGNGFVLKHKLIQFLQPVLAPLNTQQITLGNGSNDVLDILARTFAGPGDEVIFSQYAFAVYPIATQAAGAVAVVTPAVNWGHDLDAMLDAITERTKLIFIANPNNPTGTCLSAVDLKAFLEQVPAHIVVVVDEAYEEYAADKNSGFSAHYQSMLSQIPHFENLVITRTFSKAYGLAGFRVGYSISSETIADLLNRVRQPFNNNLFALDCAAIALDDQEHIKKSVELNWQGMRMLVAGFQQLGLDYIPSAGNFVCVQTGTDSAKIYEQLLYKGVIVRPVANYQMTEHLRISIGSMEENTRVLEALSACLKVKS